MRSALNAATAERWKDVLKGEVCLWQVSFFLGRQEAAAAPFFKKKIVHRSERGYNKKKMCT